jgi:hypothetical protein
MAPVWGVGDEWQYAYKSPSGSGTFVWSVNRIESVDDTPHYVIKLGAREIFYRVSDLASTLERVDGVVVIRNKPAQLLYVWPLVVGKTWEQGYVREQPVDRQTENRDRRYTVDGEETITVPAGTFRALKVVWRNKSTNALVYEMWFAPDVKQWIKDRDILSNGIRERELLAFKLKQPVSAMPPSERQERDVADLTPTVAALVKKYEAAQPVAPVPDAERAALAREIIEATATREMLSLTFSPERFKERMGAQATASKISPKLRDAIGVTALASFRADRIGASLERGLSETLDSMTLRVGLEWERSEPGRTINRLEVEAEKAELQAAKNEFVAQFIKKGGTANDARARTCAQKDILDNSAEAMLPFLEAIFAAAGMAASAQQGQPLDLDAIQRFVVGLRPILRDATRQAGLAECLFSLRRLSDAEFDTWLEFLRTDLGGRYARGVNAALKEALLEAAEVFTRTLVDVARQLKGSGQS